MFKGRAMYESGIGCKRKRPFPGAPGESEPESLVPLARRARGHCGGALCRAQCYAVCTAQHEEFLGGWMPSTWSSAYCEDILIAVVEAEAAWGLCYRICSSCGFGFSLAGGAQSDRSGLGARRLDAQGRGRWLGKHPPRRCG